MTDGERKTTSTVPSLVAYRRQSISGSKQRLALKGHYLQSLGPFGLGLEFDPVKHLRENKLIHVFFFNDSKSQDAEKQFEAIGLIY